MPWEATRPGSQTKGWAFTLGLTDATRVVKAMIRYIADTEGRTDAIDRDVTLRRFIPKAKQ